MPEVKATIHYQDAIRRMRNMDKAGDRAAMYALRATGRKVKQAAKSEAPVYQGPPRVVTYAGTQMDMKPRMLRNSIHSSKRIKRIGPELSITVSPHGFAQFYAKAQEQRFGFMRKGYDVGAAIMAEEHERALKNAIEKAMR